MEEIKVVMEQACPDTRLLTGNKQTDQRNTNMMSENERQKMDAYCCEQVGLNCIVDSENDSDSWEQMSSKADQPQEEIKYSNHSLCSEDELLKASSIKSINLVQDSERKLAKVSPRDCASEGANSLRQLNRDRVIGPLLEALVPAQADHQQPLQIQEHLVASDSEPEEE